MEETKGVTNLKFGKAERLRHKTLVERLYTEGKSAYDFPLRVTWRAISPEELDRSFRGEKPKEIGKLQMMVTVPKKKRRHAVDRVLLRRRIREAYRLNRSALKDALLRDHPEIGHLALGFVYIHTENCDYRLIEKKMVKLLKKIAQELAADGRTTNEELRQ